MSYDIRSGIIMYRLQNGKFLGANIAFIPPDLYNIDFTQNECIDIECLKFISLDNSIVITICIEKNMPDEETSLKEFTRDNNYYRLTKFEKIKRGNRYGLGAYYGKTEYTATTYREVHHFKLNDNLENQVSVMISAAKWRLNELNPIYSILGVPQVKFFLDNLEYFG